MNIARHPLHIFIHVLLHALQLIMHRIQIHRHSLFLLLQVNCSSVRFHLNGETNTNRTKRSLRNATTGYSPKEPDVTSFPPFRTIRSRFVAEAREPDGAKTPQDVQFVFIVRQAKSFRQARHFRRISPDNQMSGGQRQLRFHKQERAGTIGQERSLPATIFMMYTIMYVFSMKGAG